jgi:hypothetical protein
MMPVRRTGAGACGFGCEAGEFGQFSTGVLSGLQTLTVTVHQLVNNTP